LLNAGMVALRPVSLPGSARPISGGVEGCMMGVSGAARGGGATGDGPAATCNLCPPFPAGRAAVAGNPGRFVTAGTAATISR
jgi:hypothetical protein